MPIRRCDSASFRWHMPTLAMLLRARTQMRLGLGLYYHQLDEEHFRFARQCGCTHIVVHMVDYFRSSRSNLPGDQPVGDDSGWGLAGDPESLWSLDELKSLRKEVNRHGLEIEAIENFDPAHWYDVLLDGPKKMGAARKTQVDDSCGRAGRHPCSGL